MKLVIEIEMDNAAFGHDCFGRGQEVKKILEHWLKAARSSEVFVRGLDGIFLDRNGNTVGAWKVSE